MGDGLALQVSPIEREPIPEELLNFELPPTVPYQIGIDDVLVVKIVHTQDVPGYGDGIAVTVKDDGKIRLPMLKEHQAAGLTVSQLEKALAEPVNEFWTGAVASVTVAAHQSKRFFIVGEVNNPGTLPVDGKMTLMEALISVGGTNKDTADLDEAYVIRNHAPIPFSIEDMVMSAGFRATNAMRSSR